MNSNNNLNNILVSGATGFLGSKVILKLCHLGYNVTGISRTWQACKDSPQLHNLKWLVRDISTIPITTEEACCFDTIIHLAGATEGRGEDRYMHLYANEMTTIGLTSHEAPSIEKFIFTSTQVVYGNPNSLSVDENYPMDPSYSNYAASKINAENWLKSYQAKTCNMTMSLRLSGFINGGGLIDSIIDDCLKGRPIELFNYGRTCRDYIQTDVFIDILILLLQQASSNEYTTLNIGLGQVTSAFEIASLIKYQTRSGSEIVLSSKQPRRDNFIFNLDKLIEKTNFQPPSLKQLILDYLQIKIHDSNLS